MATLAEIRRRIASVKNTQQITRAMQAVAASKLRPGAGSGGGGSPMPTACRCPHRSGQPRDHYSTISYPSGRQETITDRGLL